MNRGALVSSRCLRFDFIRFSRVDNVLKFVEPFGAEVGIAAVETMPTPAAVGMLGSAIGFLG